MTTDIGSPIELKDAELFRSLSSSELKALVPFLRENNYDKGEVIFSAGEECGQVLIVRSGRVKVSFLSDSGKEQILEVLESGQTCACHPASFQWRCQAAVQALTDCRVWLFPKADYDRLLKSNQKLLASLSHIFANRLCRFCSLIEGISLDEPDKRLIKFILDSVKNNGRLWEDEKHYYISFTHEEISQRLGLVRETVTRHLNKLKRLQLIDMKFQQIIVLKEDHLRGIVQPPSS